MNKLGAIDITDKTSRNIMCAYTNVHMHTRDFNFVYQRLPTFMFSGGSPWPVVDTTNTTTGSLIRLACRSPSNGSEIEESYIELRGN